LNAEISNVISIDVENWNCRPIVRKFERQNFHDEHNMEGVVDGVKDVLSLFKKYNRIGTFFVLGTVATLVPESVELIEQGGHEVAIHGFHHRRLEEFDREEFVREIQQSSLIIQKITGNKPQGFRAPNFSMTAGTGWALDVLQRAGFEYDSSIMPSFNVANSNFDLSFATSFRKVYRPSHANPLRQSSDPGDTILEFPTMARRFLGFNVPAGGGFYMRLLGHDFILKAIKNMNKHGAPAMFYLHNWEIRADRTGKLPRGISYIANFGIPATMHFRHILRNVKTATAVDVVARASC